MRVNLCSLLSYSLFEMLAASENAINTRVFDKPVRSFLTSKTQEFAVDGSSLPDVDFDAGESYAGLLPISSFPNESRELYFWFWPCSHAGAQNEITIWLQGGPGAASTGGLLLENGPIIFQPGTVKATRNTFSWNNLTNMVWIDQPVGTGFSVGKPNITNEYELTTQFMGFFKNFVDVFNLHNYNVYLTGESYAGYYIPYIADGFLKANDSEYFNLKGAAINDPIIGNGRVHTEVTAMQYLRSWSRVFGFDSDIMAKFDEQSKRCGYDAYVEKYLQFPPSSSGPFPGPFGDANFGTDVADGCYIQGAIIDAAAALNPCFNVDHILDTCPIPYSPLGVGIFDVDFNPPGPVVYYNREDVKQAVHAPVDVTWRFLAAQEVFVGRKTVWEVGYPDVSLPPAQIGILSKVIEATNNIIVGVGALDFLLPANGTLLVFQNMTWNGHQGFSAFPRRMLFVPKHPVSNDNSLSGYGNLGTWISERGLTFFISTFAGHEDPWYTPGVMYRVLQTLLGRVPDLGATESF